MGDKLRKRGTEDPGFDADGQSLDRKKPKTSHLNSERPTNLHGLYSQRLVNWENQVYGTDVELDRTETALDIVDGVDDALSQRGEEEICFGALCDARSAFRNQFRLDKSYFSSVMKSKEKNLRFPIASRANYYSLQSPRGKDFAILDTRTARILDALADLSPACAAEAAVVNDNDGSEEVSASASKVPGFKISINLFGRRQIYDKVGSVLSKMGAFLQHPYTFREGVKYDNPHYFKASNDDDNLTSYISNTSLNNIENEEVLYKANEILDSLDYQTPDKIVELRGSSMLQTTLRRHQEVGVNFILQQEDPRRNKGNSMWIVQSGQGECLFEHQITNQLLPHIPDLPLGGILADVMGLGKTLTVLAAIHYTIEAAHQFSRTVNSQAEDEFPRVKSTLVVVPSFQVLEEWVTQIQTHLAPNSLRFTIFHGLGKIQDVESLMGYDIVLTTYSTLGADRRTKDGLLFKLTWFRIVLDEAHNIRNQSTERFGSAYNIEAERRWCLTGTPIQNRLEDLASLLKFLRVEPFCTSSTFEKYIIKPLFSKEADSGRNLRLLFRCVCLRRNHSQIQLPRTNEEIVWLRLSDDELALYSKVFDGGKKANDAAISSNSSFKKYAGLFTTLLRLRILCNLGTFELRKASPFLNESPGLSNRTPNALQITDPKMCKACLTNLDTSIASIPTVICPLCSENLCSSCFQYHDIACHGEPDLDSRVFEQHSSARNGPTGALNFFTPGHSTKLLAVVENIERNIQETKSIVFSCWTSTLDLLEKLLSARNIRPSRIDGTVNARKRSQIVTEFQSNPSISVLLMSIGTGAVGLNIPAANRVHIIEPQWNPSVEEQAIGRALRLGQTRSVTIIRYIMEHTVEQNIRELQSGKAYLTKVVLADEAGQYSSQSLERLRSILRFT